MAASGSRRLAIHGILIETRCDRRWAFAAADSLFSGRGAQQQLFRSGGRVPYLPIGHISADQSAGRGTGVCPAGAKEPEICADPCRGTLLPEKSGSGGRLRPDVPGVRRHRPRGGCPSEDRPAPQSGQSRDPPGAGDVFGPVSGHFGPAAVRQPRRTLHPAAHRRGGPGAEQPAPCLLRRVCQSGSGHRRDVCGVVRPQSRGCPALGHGAGAEKHPLYPGGLPGTAGQRRGVLSDDHRHPERGSLRRESGAGPYDGHQRAGVSAGGRQQPLRGLRPVHPPPAAVPHGWPDHAQLLSVPEKGEHGPPLCGPFPGFCARSSGSLPNKISFYPRSAGAVFV